jgi:hypothetical protein
VIEIPKVEEPASEQEDPTVNEIRKHEEQANENINDESECERTHAQGSISMDTMEPFK